MIIDNQGGDDIDENDIIDTSAVKTAEGFAGFMQDMWLFIKAAAPYLGGAALLATAFIVIKKRISKKE